MSACIDIPECIELKPSIKHDENIVSIDIINKCDYDLFVHLYIKKKGEQDQVLQSVSIDIKASERKNVDIHLSDVKNLVISGEWGLKGTSLRLPLKETILSI